MLSQVECWRRNADQFKVTLFSQAFENIAEIFMFSTGWTVLRANYSYVYWIFQSIAYDVIPLSL